MSNSKRCLVAKSNCADLRIQRLALLSVISIMVLAIQSAAFSQQFRPVDGRTNTDFPSPALNSAYEQSLPGSQIDSSVRSANVPTPYTNFDQPPEIDIRIGTPRPVIDGLGNVFGVPRKLLLWNRRVDNHNVSPETVREVSDYLQFHNLRDVQVRVNQYDPLGEWRRLVANKRIAPGWKYTLGTLTHLRYTLFPGRIYGGDEYNPFSNTVSLYSDVPAMGLAESAYAYDVQSRYYPGTYAAVQELPFVAMWHETTATNEVLSYVALRGDDSQLAETRRVLYSRYGLELGGQLGGVLPDGSMVFQILGAGIGRATAHHENQARNHAPSTFQRR